MACRTWFEYVLARLRFSEVVGASGIPTLGELLRSDTLVDGSGVPGGGATFAHPISDPCGTPWMVPRSHCVRCHRTTALIYLGSMVWRMGACLHCKWYHPYTCTSLSPQQEFDDLMSLPLQVQEWFEGILGHCEKLYESFSNKLGQ